MPVYYKKGDAIKGERVIAKTRKVGKIDIIRMSNKHRGKQIMLEKLAYCVIDREIEPIRMKEK